MDEKINIDKIASASIEFYEKYFSIIKHHFNNIDINLITVMNAQQLLNMNAQTTRKCKGIKQVLSALFNYAERINILEKNIIIKIKTVAYSPKETFYYNTDQFKTLLNILRHKNHHLLVSVLIMGTCGLRPSEVEALELCDITNNYIDINKSVCFVTAQNGNLKRIIKETKTKKVIGEYL